MVEVKIDMVQGSFAPDSSGKDETILKKNFRNICSGFFFPERNFILRVFLSGMSFSFLFPDFYFRNTIISFPDFFSRMYYLSIPDFFVQNRILNFVSGFLFPKLNNHFQIYFSGIYYFQFQIFISGITGIFGIFKIVLGAG